MGARGRQWPSVPGARLRNVFLLKARTAPEDTLQSPQGLGRQDRTSCMSSSRSGWAQRPPNLVHSSRSRCFGCRFLSHITSIFGLPKRLPTPTVHLLCRTLCPKHVSLFIKGESLSPECPTLCPSFPGGSKTSILSTSGAA